MIPWTLVGSWSRSGTDEDDGEVVAAQRGDLVHPDEECGVDAGPSGAWSIHCPSTRRTARRVVFARSPAAGHDGGGTGKRCDAEVLMYMYARSLIVDSRVRHSHQTRLL